MFYGYAEVADYLTGLKTNVMQRLFITALACLILLSQSSCQKIVMNVWANKTKDQARNINNYICCDSLGSPIEYLSNHNYLFNSKVKEGTHGIPVYGDFLWQYGFEVDHQDSLIPCYIYGLKQYKNGTFAFWGHAPYIGEHQAKNFEGLMMYYHEEGTYVEDGARLNQLWNFFIPE